MISRIHFPGATLLVKTFCSIGLLVFLSCGDSQGDKRSKAEEPVGSETVVQERERIVFFGNSITAGLGLQPEENFPSLLQARIDSLGWPFKVVNAGLSGDTSSNGLNRLDWVLRNEISVFVLELGANDGLRGLPVAETRENLRAIVQQVHQKDPTISILLAGMKMPPSLGQEYTRNFEQMFPEIAREEEIQLIPFLLEGVAGNPDLNLSDGIHPNAAGQRRLADNVWEFLQPILRERLRSAAP